MAFGYIESEYGILEDHRPPARGDSSNQRRYELRQDVLGNYPPYIALFTMNPAGEVLSDLLLRYADEATVREDWTKLVGPEVVKLDDLQFIEQIEDHHTGYTRNGGVAMY